MSFLQYALVSPGFYEVLFGSVLKAWKAVQIIFPSSIECMWLQTSRTSVVRSCMLDHMWKRSQTQSVKTQLKSFLFSCKSNTTSLFSAVRISHIQTSCVSGLVRVTAVLDLMALSCSLRSHSSPLTRRTAARGSSDEETRRGGSWLTDAILSGKWVQFCASHKNNTNSLSVLTLNKKCLGIYTLWLYIRNVDSPHSLLYFNFHR